MILASVVWRRLPLTLMAMSKLRRVALAAILPLVLVACGPSGGNARRPVVADVPAAAASSAPGKKGAAPPHVALPRSVTTHPAGPQQVVFHGQRNAPRVALTFDSNMTTYMLQELRAGTVRSFVNTRVMDELDAMQVPATFFLSGLWMQQYPAETRRLATDPLFELGSHSYSHRAFHGPCYGLGTLAPGTMAADVLQSERLLHRFDPRATRFFRFPGGCYDRQALAEIARTGVVPVEYDDVSGDAFGTSVAAVAQQTLAGAQPGSIIVMHIPAATPPR